MKVFLDPEAKKDLEGLEKGLSERILKLVKQLSTNPLPENSYVIYLPDGTQIQCLKLQEEDRNSKLDHRVTYDIRDDSVRVFGVFPRDPGFQNIKEKTAERRD